MPTVRRDGRDRNGSGAGRTEIEPEGEAEIEPEGEAGTAAEPAGPAGRRLRRRFVASVPERLSTIGPYLQQVTGARGTGTHLTGDVAAGAVRLAGKAVTGAVRGVRAFTEKYMVAMALQRSLMSARIPNVPGVEFALRYESAGGRAHVGGDFLEVLRVGERVLIAIGDVQGHSLHAATVMAELRHALRAFVDEGHGPKAILCRLNSILQRYHPDETATACLVLLDPRTGELEIANAGHIPPLISSESEARYAGHSGVLIGFPTAEVAGVEHLVLPPGGTVVLITDGLIEDRAVPMDDNLDRLLKLAETVDEDLEEFSDRILGEFGCREDDVALVVLRRR